ncbi:fasciclin domain-containing protein [cf. Phormidesmis sp. LEGE 11477]|uniref:fasciclin domain-containing protein n=1 Tax=cf. Phormidesmis sp. LEGE 11477 TaxID=1828680 RepID=UPI001D1364AB|nr:fasciclin domain-containing protein [cf. Phormidesmis sp. LEGE 11477]
MYYTSAKHPASKGSAIVLSASVLALGLLAVLPRAVRAEAPLPLSESVPTESAMPLPSGEFTIAEIASNSATFSTLTTALAAADLVEVLNSEGPFTVFAPTDEAFAALPAAAIETLLQPENKESLIELLTYHLVPGALPFADLRSGDVTTVEGSTIAIDVAEAVTVNSAQVISADVIASNGIIHIIDRIIIPPSDLEDDDL